MFKWMLGLWLLMLAVRAGEPTPTAEEIIKGIAARDKVLVQNRKAFDYEIDITREQLKPDRSISSTAREKITMRGNVSPSYHTRSEQPQEETKQQSREEPFELLKILDHYTYTVEGSETVDGVECWRVAFTPKPDQPYENREVKVLNNVAGHIWAAKSDYSLIRNEGMLLHPVSVAWIFATLREMEFHFDATRLPNGDYGPGRLQYRYLVNVPFLQLHERDTRQMSHYRPHEFTADETPAK